MFLIIDDYSNFKDIVNYMELKKFLIDELKRDTEENIDDENIVKNNLKVFIELADEKYKLEYIKEELKGFGWYVKDIHELIADLNDLREYIARNSSDIKVFDDVIKYLSEDLK